MYGDLFVCLIVQRTVISILAEFFCVFFYHLFNFFNCIILCRYFYFFSALGDDYTIRNVQEIVIWC